MNMILNCSKQVLYDALNIVTKAIAAKPINQILEGVQLNAKDGLVLTGNDLDLGIECVIEADIQEKGAVVLNARMFLDIVRRLPDADIFLQVDENWQTTIKCKSIEYKIMGMDPAEYPAIPIIDGIGSFSISSNTLKSMIRQTIFAVSVANTRQVLTGSLFEVDQNTLKVVSVDGFRMAIRSELLNGQVAPLSFVVPGKTLNELLKILKDDEIEISITLTDKYVMFSFENSKIVSRLIEGEFLNYKKILPAEQKMQITLVAADFMQCIERCEPIIAEDAAKNPIRLLVEDDMITIQCVTATGRVFDCLPISPTGEQLEIGFNHKYLKDALKACETDEIVIELNTQLSPCLIKPTEGNAFLYMVLPVRLKTE